MAATYDAWAWLFLFWCENCSASSRWTWVIIAGYGENKSGIACAKQKKGIRTRLTLLRKFQSQSEAAVLSILIAFFVTVSTFTICFALINRKELMPCMKVINWSLHISEMSEVVWRWNSSIKYWHLSLWPSQYAWMARWKYIDSSMFEFSVSVGAPNASLLGGLVVSSLPISTDIVPRNIKIYGLVTSFWFTISCFKKQSAFSKRVGNLSPAINAVRIWRLELRKAAPVSPSDMPASNPCRSMLAHICNGSV